MPPMVGFYFPLVVKLLWKNRISPKYLGRMIVILLINIIGIPSRIYERLFYNRKLAKRDIKEAPIFILGHWRSGTTLLHNLMCQDPQMGYVTTYQSVFPDQLLTWFSRFIFRNFTKLFIPLKRLGDNVKLGINYPQEEDFATGSNLELCYYYFFFFPAKTKEYFNSYILFNGISIRLKKSWQKNYRIVVQKALKNTKGSRFLSKNPPNIGRTQQLLEIFPDAKFIHIYRNPVEVYLSTKHFMQKMIPVLQFHSISDEELEENIFFVYREIMKHYFKERHHIPKENLYEIAFEDLEMDPVNELEKIYTHLNIPGFKKAIPNFESFSRSSKGYKKNVHKNSKKNLDRIINEWGFAMKELNYKVPDDVIIVD